MVRIAAAPEGIARRGRPPLHETGRKRGYFNARLSDHVKAALEEAARREGRSLSEEIEFLLSHLVMAQWALGGRFSAALCLNLLGIAATEGGGKDWALDPEAYNAIHNRWLELLRAQAPPLSESLKRRIQQTRANVQRIERSDLDAGQRSRLISAIEARSKDAQLPPDVLEEFRAAAAAARAKWGAS